MAISDLLNRRVRAHADDQDEEVDSEGSESASGPEDDDGSEEDSNEDRDDGSEMNGSDEGSDSESDSSNNDNNNDIDNDDIQASINNISFGALAKAQSSLPKKQKQRHTVQQDESTGQPQVSPLDDIRARIQEAREQKRQAQAIAKPSQKPTKHEEKDEKKRTSKHAPMVQSSKHAVTRRRTVIEPPSVPRTRDPRFDPTVVGKHGRMDAAASESAYGFLNEYRASEIRDLKEQLKKSKNAEQKEELKRAVRSATDRMREIENRRREQRILAEHKRSEKELIREGKKSTPYYMKKSDVKKEVLLRKYNDMNSKDRAKALERRRKKMSSKERLQMPGERRGLDSSGSMDGAGARKRKRTA